MLSSSPLVEVEAAEGSLARAEYALQLHAALLRTMRAAIQTRRAQHDEEPSALISVVDELDLLEQRLAELPVIPSERPMLGLAHRLGLGEHEVGFLWTVVALAVNPCVLVHARGLDDTAPRGLSVSLFQRIANLEAEDSCALGFALRAGHAAARHGLLVAARGEWVAAAQPWAPADALVRYLAGEPSQIATLASITIPVEEIRLDAAQHAAAVRIQTILANREPLVLYIEGPALAGRRTAVALAFEGPVLGLDLAQLSPQPSTFGEALVALRREAALRNAMPVIIGIEELWSAEGNKDPRMRLLAQHLDLADGPTVLISSWRGIDVGSRLPAVRIEWPIPDVQTRGELWQILAGVPHGHDAAAGHLAHRYPLGVGAIRRAIASLIANELGLDLYQVDLSKVVSKWIGESEKQLAKVFDAAEEGHVLLLFDEADALFGQRSTSMQGATDRYANLEVNFLLQRIERFNGIVILTTNLDASIDKALKRRLASHIVFQHPDDEERAQLWRQLLSADGAPLARDIDVRKLAQTFSKMSGAHIRNAALAAAFMTAAEGRKTIDHATVMRAARGEYISMGHVLAVSSTL